MEPTVLAGAVEFSPLDIALIVAVLIAAFVILTAPGWVVLAFVMGRLPAPGATPRKRWAARVGGAFAGLAICAGTGSLIGPVLGLPSIVNVPLTWGACWALAALLHRRTPTSGLPPVPAPLPSSVVPGPVPPPVPPATGQGWGR